MYNNFKRIENEFKIDDHINKDKIIKMQQGKLSINLLNGYERQIINFGHALIMLSYHTTQLNLVSYYIIEFNEKIVDILKINIAALDQGGYSFHSVKSMYSDKNKEKKYLNYINAIIKNDLLDFDSDDMAYLDHQDLAYIIDTKRNIEEYFK